MADRIKRSAGLNAAVVGGITAVFVILGAVAWFAWDAAAQSGVGTDGSGGALAWALVVVGGPVVLLAALIWSRLRTRRLSQVVDPTTPSDDPSKGMSGHD